MSQKKVFLENSIQIYRLLHTEKRRRKIRQNLLGKQIYSSSYVLMEFRRTILQDICFVHSIVETECDVDENAFLLLSDLDRELSSGKGNYSARSAKRSRLVTAAVQDEFPFAKAPRSELLEFLEFQIEQLEAEFFEADFNDPKIPDIPIHCLSETDCDLAKGTFGCDISKMSCSRSKARCKLPECLKEHKDQLIEIRDAFEKTSKKKQDVKMIEATDRIIASGNWDVAKGQKNCWPLGDAIIALEAPTDASIYTKDRHFDIICPAIGKKTCQEI